MTGRRKWRKKKISSFLPSDAKDGRRRTGGTENQTMKEEEKNRRRGRR